MGQSEVYDFLKDHREEWFTARQISEKTGLSFGSVSVALKGLRKTDSVEYKKIITEGYKGSKRETFAYRFKKEEQSSIVDFY